MKKSKKTPYIQHDWEKIAKKAMKIKNSPFKTWLDDCTEFQNGTLFFMRIGKGGYEVPATPITYGEAYQTFLMQQKP